MKITPKQAEELAIEKDECVLPVPKLTHEQISALLKMEHPESVRPLIQIGVMNLGWILDLMPSIHDFLDKNVPGFNAEICTTAAYLMHFPEFPVSMLLRSETFAEALLDFAFEKSDDIRRVQSIIGINCNGTEIHDFDTFRQYCFNTAIDFKVI